MTNEIQETYKPIDDGEREKFDTLARAAENGHLGLAVAKHSRTGERHLLLIVAWQDEPNGKVNLRALGRMFETTYDPTQFYELPGAPEVVEFKDEDDEGET